MSPDEWWTRWRVLWLAIGWRRVAARSNYNIEDVFDVCAALLMRIARLEGIAARTPFFGIF